MGSKVKQRRKPHMFLWLLLYCLALQGASGNVRKIERQPTIFLGTQHDESDTGSYESWEQTALRLVPMEKIVRSNNSVALEKIVRNNNSHCEPELYHHYYITRDNKTESATNSWKRTKAGESGGLMEICLKPNGLPYTRQCVYSHHLNAPTWAEIAPNGTQTCLRRTREPIITTQLNSLHDDILDGRRLKKGKKGRIEVTELLCDILEKPNYKLLPADVHFAAKILREVASEAKDTELSGDIVNICNIFMSSDRQVLRKSADLNATNALLETFETYMDGLSGTLVSSNRCGTNLSSSIITKPSSTAPGGIFGREQAVQSIHFSDLGVRVHLTAKVSVFFMNPICANISGIAIYDANSQNRHHPLMRELHGGFLYRFVYMHETVNELMKESGLQVAAFVPQTLWRHVENSFSLSAKQAIIVLKVYAHDALFVEHGPVRSRKPFSKVLSISIPGFNGTFFEALPFLLRNDYFYNKSASPQASNTGAGCGYWNYNTWVNAGVESGAKNFLAEGVILCGTKHLTQFSFLLGGSYRQNELGDDVLITPLHERVLDIISIIGCSLSLLGMLGIWLTAALFRSWRSLASTKVLLNLCVALTLQMVLFLFVNTDDISEHLVEERGYINCIVLGALLQYSILVLFSWMLIVAFLQFQRYVTVIGVARPQHYILKSACAAWGFPLIPTLLVACIDHASYIPTAYQLSTDTGICYPSGHGLTFGVVLPVTLIIIANLVIFIYVFYSISHSLSQSLHRAEKKMIMKQIRLSVLLFFLLGLSWIFGIFAYMRAGVFFSYLFCLTATLQGFVLFIYFVVLDEVTARAWRRLLCSAQDTKKELKSTELQSMNTTSTALGATSEAQEMPAKEAT